MSETYADDYRPETAGGVLVVAISILATILVLAGLYYAIGTSARHKTALAVNNCEPSMSPSGLPCNTQAMVISEFNGIVNPASKLLAADMVAYRTNEGRHLAAAEAALTSEVATERALDNSLTAVAYTSQNYGNAINLITIAFDSGASTPGAAILLTPQATAIANTAMRDNQALATLTARQARSATLTQLRSYNHRVNLATTAVRTELTLLRKAIEAPLSDG